MQLTCPIYMFFPEARLFESLFLMQYAKEHGPLCDTIFIPVGDSTSILYN